MGKQIKMKRLFIVLAVALTSVSALRAYEFPGFEYTVGADLTTAYLWRGMNYGGLSLQPDVMVGYGGAQLEAWANLSPSDWKFTEFAPELDLTLSYSISGFTVGVTHQYYFDKTKYFDYRKPSLADYENGDYATNQTEVFAKMEFGELFESFPLTIMWATLVGGDDWRPLYEDANDPDKLTGIKQAYSSYLEVSYDFELPLGFSLTPTVGMTPWKSLYSYYEKNFAVNNIALKLNWELEVAEHFAIDVYGITSLNTAGVNKNNLFATTGNAYSNDMSSRHWNFALGVGIWLY